jgi:hypothetical protein
MDYRENAASTGLKLRIIRNVDGRYWDGSAWQVAVQNLAVTASTVNARATWENIDVGAGATTITLTPVLLAGTVGRIAYIKHAQVEAGAWASSRIVSNASAVTRALDSLKISNNTAARSLNNARGTLLLEYRPSWRNAAAATVFPLFDVTYDASNWFRLYYIHGTGLRFEARVGGTTYTAEVTGFAASAGTTHKLAARWTSVSGELGLAAYTISAFADGTKDDSLAIGTPVEAGTSDLYIGGNSAATQSADGVVRAIFHTQQVLTDDEISRGF